VLDGGHRRFIPGKETWCPFNRKLVSPSAGIDVLEMRKISFPNRDSNTGSEIWVEKKVNNEECCNVKSSPDLGVVRCRMNWKSGGGGRTHFEGEKILFGNSVDRVQIILCAKGTAILLNIPQESDGLPWPTSTPNPTT